MRNFSEVIIFVNLVGENRIEITGLEFVLLIHYGKGSFSGVQAVMEYSSRLW